MVEQFLATQAVPTCRQCGSALMKHATISFGQALAPDVLQAAYAWAKRSRLFLAIGSSLVVEPAASLPRKAKEHGARLVIVNREPTPQDSLADLVIRRPIGETLAEIDRELEKLGAV
ncbi:MAG TPA: Sir2 family NAD-dependent protein deacetylase [Pirellulales bacterium]|nr:Sir2 family NAD-dependent protein deacetylase [Pirellulales bacterium]